MNTQNIELEISRSDLANSRIVERPLPELQPGQVRFHIDRYAVTSNTVTYAVTGDTGTSSLRRKRVGDTFRRWGGPTS
jgi:hypothetical protein